MTERVIGIGLDATAKPVKRLKVSFGVQLSHTDKMEPKKGARIARRQPQRLLDMLLHLLVVPQRMLAEPDERMRLGQIPIQRQRLPTFSDTLGSAVCPNLNSAEKHVGSGMVGRTQ